MDKLPFARNTDVVMQELDGEILIYDSKTHKAYNLNETSAIVYTACNGKTSFDELKNKHNFTDDLIFLALDELRKENLLKEDNSYKSPFAGISRREVIKKVALGSLIALPVILALTVPKAIHAQSVVCIAQSSCTCQTTNGLAPTACIDADSCGGPTCVCIVQGLIGGDSYFGVCADFDPNNGNGAE